MSTTISPATWRAGLSALSLALLAGCSLTPTYERPEAPVPSQWPQLQADDAAARAAAELPWQDFVQDERLRELIALALEGNRDLRVAAQRIEQARAAWQIRRADQLPTVAASAGGQRSRPNAAAALGGPSVASNYSVGLGVAAWELDFFGRIEALQDAALASYLATEEAHKAAQISLVAAVASAWLQLHTDTELLELSARTLATREQSLKLTQLRFDNGASSALELRQAESLVASAKAARAQQHGLRVQDINLLTLLVGQSLPETLLPGWQQEPQNQAEANTPLPLPGFAPLAAGLPSDQLLRRPDIRAAEQQLIGANANIGAARANFFPRISLTGSLGRVSSDLDGLFGSHGTHAWSFGPSISLPIFDHGRNQANLEAAEAAREIAVAEYEKAIQQAFREVADALSRRSAVAEQLDALQQQAEAERARLQLVDARYSNGVASHLELLDAQRSLFAIEQALSQVRLAQRVSEVQLYKALGGGWSDPPATTAAPSL